MAPAVDPQSLPSAPAPAGPVVRVATAVATVPALVEEALEPLLRAGAQPSAARDTVVRSLRTSLAITAPGRPGSSTMRPVKRSRQEAEAPGRPGDMNPASRSNRRRHEPSVALVPARDADLSDLMDHVLGRGTTLEARHLGEGEASESGGTEAWLRVSIGGVDLVGVDVGWSSRPLPEPGERPRNRGGRRRPRGG